MIQTILLPTAEEMIRVAFNLFLLPLAVFALSSVNKTSQRPIPITVLSGFLGSGKTTLLQNMLQNKEGLRVAVIVNDVASVNIDSKLVARESTGANPTGGSDGMVELQNGCACCSLSDELLTSVSELVTMSDLRGDDQGFHHIVVELSGVADPKAVRSKFQDAIFSDMPLMERVCLDTLVTLVDSSMFKEHFESTKKASRKETPELFFRPGEKPKNEIPDDMKAELPPKLLEAVMAGLNAADERADGDNSVTDLLVSQAETADIVVLNKVDLVDDSETEQLREILAGVYSSCERSLQKHACRQIQPISCLVLRISVAFLCVFFLSYESKSQDRDNVIWKTSNFLRPWSCRREGSCPGWCRR